ncbi:MAG: 2-C-methyl-D-erythritol 2,4-cyclodiphosphate synthase [Gammaproteobacteria bacterium]|nr:2-C-methyl-D-erythritol 2,4-cyclodiphosphate synthase [Gammaproteobacteria bacterium]
MRVGQGLDAHRFCAGDRVVLGGVSIPHDQALQAHSDGDVLLHAICDALLGAAALGDIGRHFSDQDAAHKNRDSREFLREVATMLATAGYSIGNIDATIVAQRPKMSPHTDLMRQNISTDLGIEVDAVNIKSTTTEQMGFTGREEGIAALAIACLQSI